MWQHAHSDNVNMLMFSRKPVDSHGTVVANKMVWLLDRIKCCSNVGLVLTYSKANMSGQ